MDALSLPSSLNVLLDGATLPGVGSQPAGIAAATTAETEAGTAPFGEILGEFLQHVDQAQHQADDMVESLALGEPVDVHQVMLSLNEASDALHLTVQVRGKLLEAYQELMRTPL